MANDSIQLRANNGQYVSAKTSSGNSLVVTSNVAFQEETFTLIDSQGNSLQDGSLVGIKCSNGRFVAAANGGGSNVLANSSSIGAWETFTIKKLGGGFIQTGDSVVFLCSDGVHYLTAEGGGGQQVVANRTAIGPWETFIVTTLPSRHIRIEVESIYCDNTEEVTGKDELYFVGAGVSRNDKQVTPVLTTPIGINDGQTKKLPPDQRIVFDGTVEATDTIIIGLKAFDEDAAKDWGDRGEKLSKIASLVSAGLIAIQPEAVIAGKLIELTVAVVDLIISSDKDDELGTWSIELPMLTLPISESRRTWNFSRNREIGYSTWNYTVTFLVYDWRIPSPPTGPIAQGDDMQSGEMLTSGQSISSTNGQHTFVYQGDGNLVLYRNSDARPLWASNSWGTIPGVCIMQSDGNLVIYDPNGNPIWASNTWQYPGSRLVVQSDGNVVIYSPDDTPVWSTNTWQG